MNARVYLQSLGQYFRVAASVACLISKLLPGLIVSAERRDSLREMRAFARGLPDKLQVPLPKAMAQLNSDLVEGSALALPEETILKLADFASILEHGSPLGLCLRRSLIRYTYLRRVGIPVQVHYGARFTGGKPDRKISGHAWLTLNGSPYHEDSDNWRGFTAMLTYPSSESEQ